MGYTFKRFIFCFGLCFGFLAGCEATVSNVDGEPSLDLPPLDSDDQDSEKVIYSVHKNLPYGSDVRQVLDLYIPYDKPGPYPVMLRIHGGGFVSGSKELLPEDLESDDYLGLLLISGIAVASINYRFAKDYPFVPGTKSMPYPVPMHDGARAVQWLRHVSKDYNLDSERVGSHGSSAGADISLWLNFHDDLADLSSSDPVVHQSSRLIVATARNAQPTLDPGGDGIDHAGWIDLKGDVDELALNFFGLSFTSQPGFVFYDLDLIAKDPYAYANYWDAFAEASSDTMVDPGEPPVFMYYMVKPDALTDPHCPVLSLPLREEMKLKGIPFEYRDPLTNPELLPPSRDESVVAAEMTTFVLEKMGITPVP